MAKKNIFSKSHHPERIRPNINLGQENSTQSKIANSRLNSNPPEKSRSGRHPLSVSQALFLPFPAPLIQTRLPISTIFRKISWTSFQLVLPPLIKLSGLGVASSFPMSVIPFFFFLLFCSSSKFRGRVAKNCKRSVIWKQK